MTWTLFGFSPDALLNFLGLVILVSINLYIKLRIDKIEHHINGMSSRLEEGAYRAGVADGRRSD